MKKFLIITLLTTTICTTGLTALSANASTLNENSNHEQTLMEETSPELTAEELQKIFDEQGIDKETQKKLIEKKLSGKLLDAENPDKIKDIPDEFYVLDMTKPSERKVYTFEDGSVCILSHEAGNPNSRKIISSAYSTTWQEEKVTATYGVMRASIYVNCEWIRSIGPRINKFTDSNIYVWNVGGQVSTTNMSTNSSTSAVGKISVYNSSYFGKQSDFRAEFKVLSNHGTVSFKLIKM